ncbi:MAG TPA: hypothetical protein VLT62_13070 [Candidatus Methylomirabilis sp.]|nr:hypothetical protein [Candidatus Methylomirabilis sp.]
MAMSLRRSLADRLTLVHIIRGIFDRSPVFREACISEPHIDPGGGVIVDVSFDHGPAAFRVVAPSAEEAYAILHELASAMVEIERDRHGWSGNGRDDHEAALADVTG